MRKFLTVISAMLLVSGLAAAGAIANGSHKGQHNSGWHGSAHGTKLVALLKAPAAGPTGVTSATSSGNRVGKYGKADKSGILGVAKAKQSSTSLKLKVGLRGLTAGGVYSIGIVQDADGQGCVSTTNAVLDPPGAKSVTANSEGKARAKLVEQSSVFALDLAKPYYIKVTDAAGATVACGNLVKWSKHRHGRGHHHSYGGGHKRH